MAQFLRHVVGGSVSFAANAIGWECPTSVQPAFASFFDGSTTNLAAGGAASSVIGTPSLVAGTASVLPHMQAVSGGAGVAGVNSGVAASPDFTLVALYQMPTITSGAAQGADIISNFTGSYTAGDPVQMQAMLYPNGNSTLHGFANTPSGGAIVNASEASFTAWQVLLLQASRSGASQMVSARNLTAGSAAQTASVANTAGQTENGGTLIIGTDGRGSGDSNTAGGNFGFAGIWQSVLSEADIQSIYGLLQRRAARYGVTV